MSGGLRSFHDLYALELIGVRSFSRIPLVILGCIALSSCVHLPEADNVAADSFAMAADSAPLGSPQQSAPVDANFIEERARQAYETGRWDVAEGYYLRLIRLKPGNAEFWYQLGNLYAEQGRLHSAERAYYEALRRRDNARTLHNLGLVQVKLGVSALRDAQKRLPQDDPARQETYEFLRILLETVLP